MIESLLNVSEKVLFLFLLIGVGVVLARKKVVTETGASQMSAVLVNIVAPCVIIGAFQSTATAFPFGSSALWARCRC